ncbi:hypothetical protein ACJX0J_025795 [Zea mays]
MKTTAGKLNKKISTVWFHGIHQIDLILIGDNTFLNMSINIRYSLNFKVFDFVKVQDVYMGMVEDGEVKGDEYGEYDKTILYYINFIGHLNWLFIGSKHLCQNSFMAAEKPTTTLAGEICDQYDVLRNSNFYTSAHGGILQTYTVVVLEGDKKLCIHHVFVYSNISNIATTHGINRLVKRSSTSLRGPDLRDRVYDQELLKIV